jgi:hypothetical protein
VGPLEDRLERIRAGIDALSAYPPPVQDPAAEKAEQERFLKIVGYLEEGKEVPDELLEEPKEGAIMSERDFLPVLKKTIEEGVFGPYPDG